MAIIFNDSMHWGFDYNYDAVTLPCHIVGKLDPNGATIMMLSYQIDSGISQGLPTPPTAQYGIVPLSASGFTAGQWYTLTVIAMTSGLTTETVSYSFKPTSTSGYSLRAVPSGQKVRATQVELPTPPRHSVNSRLVTSHEPNPNTLSNTYEITVTHAGGGATLGVAVLPPILMKQANNAGNKFAETAHPALEMPSGVPFTTTLAVDKRIRGVHTARVLVWDPNDVRSPELEVAHIITSYAIPIVVT